VLKTSASTALPAGDSAQAMAAYNRARMVTFALIAGLTCLIVLLPLFPGRIMEGLALYLALRQDLPLLPIFLAVLLLRPKVRTGPLANAPQDARTTLVLAMLAVLLAGWLGHYLVFQAYDLSRDEQMAVFDQDIFAHGRAVWPIAVEWRSVVDALNRRFMLPIGDREFWVSGYLPIHSAFRALLSNIGIASLASPLMAALGAACTWSVARRLWPESNRTVLLSLLLVVTSSQVILTSMTAFSMSMHMALNMLWLALFLADRRKTHVLAVLVGFLATGIHQPLFHPMFVMPFLFLLLGQKRWKLLSFYVGCYAAVGVFWMAWPLWIVSHGIAQAAAIDCANVNCSSGVGYVERLLTAVSAFGLRHVWLTAANLLRFIFWQNPLLVPLALAGIISCWRSEPLVRALAISFVLTILVMAVLLPWQGHGWGYRYVHPALGSAIILACFGFRSLEARGVSIQRPLLIASAAAVALLPLHAWMASRVVAPFVQIHDELAAIPADAVIVDTETVPFGQDVVYNRFDLSNRPKLMIGVLVKPANLAGLCGRSSIAFYDAPRMAPLARMFGANVPKQPSPHLRRLRAIANDLHCRVIE
jgi:hypothetical protein